MTRLHKNKEYYANTEATIERVRQEINAGLALLNKVDKTIVTFFGSHKVAPGNKYYEHCKKVAQELGRRGYAIVTGGGPGIMHAANTGATQAKAPSIGLKAELLKGEKITDPIFTGELSFRFLFIRRFVMSIKSEALIFYPGGYGTLNELFEYVVLMQTGIVDTVPVICVSKKYWRGLFDWLKDNPLKNEFFIHDIRDLHLIHLVDDFDEVMEIIEKGR